MDYEKMTAPCGLACFDCVVYLANEDRDMRARVSRQFGIPEEKVHCRGCRAVEGRCPIAPSFCRIFSCASDRGVKFCYECSDFPCDELHPYADQADRVPLNTRVFNLCLIKKMGLDDWAKHRASSVKRKYFTDKLGL